MVAIIDSGSTKSDWVILDKEGTEAFRTHTIGFNPYFIGTKDIIAELKKNEDLSKVVDKIKTVYFYGAGCSSEKLQKVIESAFDQFFYNANNYIEHDLLAAAYSAYTGKPAIVCILGTGSNSCYFDGENLHEETSSLAFILGDEGSGNHLGRMLLRYYFSNKLPKHLANAFKERYELTVEEMNRNVYQNKFANTYLATFSRFVADHKYEPFMQQMIYKCMKEFIEFQILPYPQAATSEINFIGSVAHYYEETLKAALGEYNLKIGHIVRKPIDDLVKYHKLYMLPSNQVKK